MDFDEVQSDGEDDQGHLLQDDIPNDDDDSWRRRERSPTPVYGDDSGFSKSKPRKRLVKKSAGETPPHYSGVEDDDSPAAFRGDFDEDDFSRKRKEKDSGGGSKGKEKRLKFEKKDKGFNSGLKKGMSRRSKDQDGDAEVKELWDTIAGGDSEVPSLVYYSSSENYWISLFEIAGNCRQKYLG